MMVKTSFILARWRDEEHMAIKTVLFDLDGTLLPMDQEHFTKSYFKLLTEKLAAHGYEPGKLVDSIWAGTMAMIGNDGHKNNEGVFWERFSQIYGERALEDKPLFDAFYREEFQGARDACGYDPEAAATVAKVKEMGYKVVLATNPIFPATATESRIRWAGLDPADFVFYTTYENTGYCKPDPRYYSDIIERLGADPEECCMVGNDVDEDMVAGTLGMQVFLLTDCLINKGGKDISVYPHGGFGQLLEFLKKDMV